MTLLEYYQKQSKAKRATWASIGAEFGVDAYTVHRWAHNDRNGVEAMVRGRKPNRRIERVTVLAEEVDT